MTKKDAKKLVLAAEATYTGINTTRWYSTVVPKRNGEARILTWAAKTWQGKPLVMLAAEYHTDKVANKVSGRLLVHNFTNQMMFNWLDYGGKEHVAVWSDVDAARNECFDGYDHVYGKGREFYGRFLNGLEDTKYKWCGWALTDMRISDYLDCYRVSPFVECLAKAGLCRWITPRFVARLVGNKPLMRFVARNAEKLRDVPPSIVISQYARHAEKTDVDAIRAATLLRTYGLTSLPYAPKRICAWLDRNGVSPEELRHHVDNLNELKLDLAYEPHVLPHDFAVYSLEVEDRVHEERELAAFRESEIVREAREFAHAKIEEWLATGKIRKSYSVVLPNTEQELREEGSAMNNCVGTYWSRIVKGSCSLVFIRKEGKPYIDMEVSRDGKIVQMRYNHNKAVDAKTPDGRLCAKLATAFRKSA